MIALPCETPFTVAEDSVLLTVATLSSLLVHVKLLHDAFEGETVAVNVAVPPRYMLIFVLSSETDST